MSADIIGVALTQELAQVSQGRNPDWKLQTELGTAASFTNAEPTSDAVGNSVKKSIVALAAVLLRENPAKHRSRVRITTLLLTDTYNVTIDGNLVAYDAGAAVDTTELEVITGIADALNADVTVGPIVNATVENRSIVNGVTDYVVVIENVTAGSTTHTTAVSTAGAGVLAFDEDAQGATIQFWALPDDENDAGISLGYCKVNGALYALTANWLERMATAGLRRIFGSLSSVTSPTGAAIVQVVIAMGPGAVEQSQTT